jgi:SAM-dependent methyltransferase
LKPLAELSARLPQGAAVLDVGCGNFQRIHRNLARRRADISVAGLERFEDESIYGPAPIYAPCSGPRFKRHVCDIELDRFPFADETFDGAFLSHVIEHITQKQHALSEIRRTLKTGGLLYVETPGPRSLNLRWPDWLPHDPLATLNYYDDKTHVGAPFSAHTLREELEAAGFSIVTQAPVREYGLLGTPIYIAMIGAGALPILPAHAREFLYGAGMRNLFGWAISALGQK